MKNIFLYLVLFSGLSFQLLSQNMEMIKSEGKIPKEFITASADKYKIKIAELDKTKVKGKSAKQEQKDKKQFLLESGFSIDDLLQSGYILFNDRASNYVNKVLNKLPLSSNVKKSNPRVYLLNSNEVNAFATEQGIIFVSVGLLANLENEAQLAFILGHELAHIDHKHGLDKFLNSKQLESKNYQRNIDKISLDKNLFSESMYSQELELEADEYGLELFLKSDYNHKTIQDVFEILHYSHLPFELKIFPKNYFNDKYYQIPEEYFREDGDIVKKMDEEEENKNDTHPSSIKRLEKMNDVLANKENTNKTTFLIGEKEFFEVQKLMRYQLPFLALESGNYGRALFNAYLLLDKYPEDVNLKKVIGKALYYKSKLRNNYRKPKGSFTINWDNLTSENIKDDDDLQQIDFLFKQMSRKGLLTLALKYNYQLQKEFSDREIDLIVEDLFIETNNHIGNISEFSNTERKVETLEEEEEEEEEEEKEEEEEEEEEEESVRKNKIAEANQNKLYWKYAFVAEKKDEKFVAAYKKGQSVYDDRVKAQNKHKKKSNKSRRAEKRKNEKFGKALGINKIALVNPFYLSLDERKDNSVQYVRSEIGQKKLRELIKTVTEKTSLKVELLDITDLGEDDIDKFNDIVTIEKYVSQQLHFDDLTLTPGLDQLGMDAIADKYDTDYFLYSGIISLREKENAGLKIVYGIVLYPLLPIILVDIMRPDYDMLYYSILFDVKTGRRSVLKMDYYNAKDSDIMIKAHTYDVFHQINRKSKR